MVKIKATKSNKTPETKVQSSLENEKNITTGSLRDDVDLLWANLENYIKKNYKTLSYLSVAVFLIISALVGGKYYLNYQDKEAQAAMFQAQFYFESDSLNKALNGDGNNLGFLEIIDNYPFTKSSALASLYAGIIYLKQEKYDEAIEYLKKYNNNDLILQSRAYCLIGDAYMEMGEFNEACTYYEKAANYKPNKQFTPEYLMKWALALERLERKKEALRCYEKVIVKYPNSTKANDAKRLKGFIEAQLGK
jgi:tetratricopeptide (TPR) repeat protein